MAKETMGKVKIRLISEIAGINYRKSASVIVGELFLSKSVRVGQQAIFQYTERDFRRESEEFPCHSREKVAMPRLHCFAIVVCLLSSVSCRPVFSLRPVPSEEDSVVDPRLIGLWEPEKNDTLHSPVMMLIAKSRNSKTTMEHLGFGVPSRSEAEVSKTKEMGNNNEELLFNFRGPLFIHRGNVNTLCLQFQQDERVTKNNDEKAFVIYRYKFQDENTVLVYELDIGHLAIAIENKHLEGKLDRSRLPDPPSETNDGELQLLENKKKKAIEERWAVHSILLDDDAKKIIAYLEDHPEAFEEKPFVYKRMNYSFVEAEIERTKKSETSAENISPPPKNKVKQSVFTRDWFSTFFLGIAAGVIFAIIAVLVSRIYKSRIAT